MIGAIAKIYLVVAVLCTPNGNCTDWESSSGMHSKRECEALAATVVEAEKVASPKLTVKAHCVDVTDGVTMQEDS